MPVGSIIGVIGEEGDDLSGAAEVAKQAPTQGSAPASKEPEPSKKSLHLLRLQQSLPNQHLSKKLLSFNLASVSLHPPLPRRLLWKRVFLYPKSKETGPSGRIIREDVDNYKPAPAAASSAVSVAAQTPAAAHPRTMSIPQFPTCAEQSARVSHSRSRNYLITTLTVDISMDKVMKLREVFNKTPIREGSKTECQ